MEVLSQLSYAPNCSVSSLYNNHYHIVMFIIKVSGSHLLSHIVSNTVSSAAFVLTIVFGMGTGVTQTRIATGNPTAGGETSRGYRIIVIHLLNDNILP